MGSRLSGALLGTLGFFSPVGGILSVIWTVIATIIKWVLDGLVVCVANPVTAAVLVVVLVVGFYLGVRHDETGLRKLQAEMAQADVDSKKRLSAAEAARKAAEDKVLSEAPAAAEAPAASPVAVKRVRHKSANCGGSWLSGVQALWGGCK